MERERRKALGHLRRAEFHAGKGDATSTRAHCARAVFYAPAFGESELRVVQIADRIANRVHVKLERLRSASAAEKAAAAALLAGGAGLLYHALSAGPAPSPGVLPVEILQGQPAESDFAELPSSLALVGIKNPGVLCYIIASIQLLYSITAVRNAVESSSLPELDAFKHAFRALGTGSHYDMRELFVAARSKLFEGFSLAAPDGEQGASDEFLAEFLRWLFETPQVDSAPFVVIEVVTLTYDSALPVIQRRPFPILPYLTVPLAGCTVQHAIDLAAEGTLSPDTRARTMHTEYQVGESSRYVVVLVHRLYGHVDPVIMQANMDKLGPKAGNTENNRLFMASQRVVTADLTPEPIRFSTKSGTEVRYALVGAVLSYSATGKSGHYVFVRTLGRRVVRVYNDGTVQADTASAQRDLSSKATVLLYQRLAEPVTPPGAP